MNSIHWTKTTPSTLPTNGQRVLYFKPTKLTKIGEMIYFDSDKESFLDEVTFWSSELKKPIEEDLERN